MLPVATGILIISTTLLVYRSSQASDLGQEQRLADEIVEAILDGEPVTLTAGSTQIRIEGTGHYFDDQNEELVEAITGWLDKTVPPEN